MKPSPKAIAKAAHRLCAKAGIEAAARDAWKRVEDRIVADEFAALTPCDDADTMRMKHRFSEARFAMLKSIIETQDLQAAEADALKAADLQP